MSHCDLHNIGFTGLPWTYDNNQVGDRNVRVRLDRAVASLSWMDWFPQVHAQHLISASSDHCPIFLDLEQEHDAHAKQQTMRYEVMWEREETLPQEIQRAWEQGEYVHGLGDVACRLKTVMASLRKWSMDKFGAVTKEIAVLKEKMEDLRSQDHIGNKEEVDKCRRRMEELLYREEMMWMQRSRVSWLKEGDRNTKFFHRKAAGRAKKNKITRLRTDDGRITKDKKEMGNMARDFFQQLYTQDPSVYPHELLQIVEPQITEEMNESLCKEFSGEEILDALFQIGPLKAPGPDGFPTRFFQRHWDIMKQYVTQGVQDFFATGKMPPGVNETSIVLLPKKDEPELLKDFRPISLCNVIYKVISKCMVNHLRPLLQELIAPTQSAFIPGRMIIDNALIAFECLHAIRNGNNNCKEFGALKLDLSKAYDRVDWGYLKGILGRLGFHSKWL
jgi:hypothetical protein